VGYTIPVALFASVLLSVCCGLFGTFSPNTPAGKWIGYQILYGVGRGLGIQMVCLIFTITNPRAHLITFHSGSQSSRSKKPYHQNKSLSPWRLSHSANRLEQPYSSVSEKPYTATVLEISSTNMHLRSMSQKSLMLGPLDFEVLFLEQISRVY
jgi:hypothetical protein